MAGFSSVRCVYIACSGPDAITPGVLCRELLIDAAGPAARVVCVNARTLERTAHTLGALYPLWPLFRGVPRERLALAATEFAAGLGSPVRRARLVCCVRVCLCVRG